MGYPLVCHGKKWLSNLKLGEDAQLQGHLVHFLQHQLTLTIQIQSRFSICETTFMSPTCAV
jgi:hypothetical protein